MTATSDTKERLVAPWPVQSRRVVADYRLFQVETKSVRSPRTGQAMDVQAIHFPDWVVVLPLTKEHKVAMIHQYRHGNEKVCLELPGGLVDPDDDSPKSAARRELREETGYGAQQMVKIGETYPQPAVLSNRCFFYLGHEIEKVGNMALDAGEDLRLEWVPIDAVRAKIRRREIDNAMTVLAFSYYWLMTPE